jgi:hypothetical protein
MVQIKDGMRAMGGGVFAKVDPQCDKSASGKWFLQLVVVKHKIPTEVNLWDAKPMEFTIAAELDHHADLNEWARLHGYKILQQVVTNEFENKSFATQSECRNKTRSRVLKALRNGDYGYDSLAKAYNDSVLRWDVEYSIKGHIAHNMDYENDYFGKYSDKRGKDLLDLDYMYATINGINWFTTMDGTTWY